ncbi:inositol monophosphatase family protein [Goodfellowiella coeruleoviolacea]|uniref:Inositol-1-monophosphatase n=1 Tax=Goodfellowiella coeruleoviolacea TaxID=334858 RepID=A0AAE3GIX7_9PSEU|nr:inositol monophosphatase family protein [Goodfellowiella coeruleoviolacea]MCP2168330.1 myo-inositol-1(or 4)-monophosphatase [Goodfellowiella coeruleoviolacea]
MRHDLHELVDTALRVATEAGELVLTTRRAAVDQVDTKSSATDVVTAGDRAAERLVRTRLAELRPGEPVLGEEEGGNSTTAGLRWVVDPIDGTVNYLYGMPWYAVSIAAQLDGVSLAGAVVEPVSGRAWTAARGHGAYLDGARLRVSTTTRLDLSLVATGFAYRVERRARQAEMVANLLPRVRDIRRAGAASLDLCAVAAGWADAYVEHGLNRWDWAAGALVAAEAGAIVTLPGDADNRFGADATVAATPGIVDELHAALHDCGFAAV